MKLLLSLASFAALIGMALPAHADSTDDSFIAALKAAGITFTDPDKAVGAGKWVCDTFKGGTQMPDVVKALQGKNPALGEDKANKFVAIAASAYCRDAISTSSSTTSGPKPDGAS
jgi:Protein of unknown function (DUF732)